MSGEANVVDDLVVGISDSSLAVGADVPRVLYPVRKKMESWFGPDIAGSVDDTAHGHMMDIFWKAPRVQMEPIGEDSALSSLLPDSDDWTWMKVQVDDDPSNTHALPVAGDPSLRRKVVRASEAFRRPRVKSLFHDDVVHPIVDQMIVFYDGAGKVIAGAVSTPEDGEEGKLLTAVPLDEALRRARVSVLRPRKESEVARLYALSEDFLGPGSEFAQETGDDTTIERFFTHETALRTVELLVTFQDDPKARKNLYAICSSPATESLVGFCESVQDVAHVADLVKKKSPWLIKLAQAYSTLGHDTITSGDPEKFLWEKPLEQHVFELGHDLIRNALFHHNDPGFRDEYLHASFQALHDTLNVLHGIELPARLPKEQTMYKGLADYATMHADDTVALSLITPVVEQIFLLKLKRIIPGKFEAVRDYFYGAIGSAMNAHSNESTGDDELQLQLLTDIFDELVALGYWHEGDVYQDAAAGSGERILRPFLRCKAMQKYPPSIVFATDALAFPQPNDGAWVAVQAQYEDPKYPHIHATHIGKQGIVPIRLITSIWSSAVDVGADKQPAMFNHWSESLLKRDEDTPGGILVLEIPTGYIDEMIAFAEARGGGDMGEVILKYPIGDDKTLDKPLEIMMMHNLLIRAMRAGFRPLNLPPGKGVIKTPAFYHTGAGKARGYFVFERVGDPQQTLDQLAVEAGKATFVGSGRPPAPA